MEVEDISDDVSSTSDNVSSAAEPSLANASSSRQTATTAITSPACPASTNGEPSCTTAAHIRDTDTCTDDAHDTAMVIITAQAQLDDNESSDVNNVSNTNGDTVISEDPVLWRDKFTDRERIEIVKTGPVQIRNFQLKTFKYKELIKL